MQVEPYWGSFELFLDKVEVFPSKEKKRFSQEFEEDKHSLINSTKNFLISDIIGFLNGVLYLGVESKTSCKLSLKFHTMKDKQISMHTLIAGKLENGVLYSKQDISYYSIQISLEENQAQSVNVDLVPLKGRFILIASKSERIPTIDSYDIISYDNHLDLVYKNHELNSEYIIGVLPFLQKADNKEDQEEPLEYSFKIGLSYSNKTNNMQPGIIQTHTLNEVNIYQIQILREMKDLMILKSIVDGYNISLCGVFSKNSVAGYETCDVESVDSQMGVYLDEAKLKSHCGKFLDKGESCLLNLNVKGSLDQLFSIGYTYNNLPFQLVENNIITGPSITKKNYSINFIFHPVKGKPSTIYFNSKGTKLRCLSLLIDANSFEGK